MHNHVLRIAKCNIVSNAQSFAIITSIMASSYHV